jgi:hypothetical protein
VAESCENGNEPSGNIIGREFFVKPIDFQLFKENCAPRNYLLIACTQ